MIKNRLILPIALLGFGLAACQQEEPEAVIETEDSAEVEVTETLDSEEQNEEDESVEEEVNVNDDEDRYQSLLDQAKQEYEAEELGAAAGTLTVLLQNDLTDYSPIQTEAESLKDEIHALQAEQAQEVASGHSEESIYKDERESTIITENYLAATGESIQEATDEELSRWFAQKDIEEEQKAVQEVASWTKEEAENYAFDQLIMIEDLNYEQYFFFVELMEEEWVQLEVREPVEQDGVTWSNLIGLYRFNVSTDELQKLDRVSGEYESVN